MKVATPRVPAHWKRPVSARDERILWVVLLVVAVLLHGLAWWQGRALSLVAIRLGLTVAGIALLAIVAEVVRWLRQRKESH